ncbi:homocitrate synthase/isopropylmalate synthase family protein [Ethanoligenens harbinense]|uniref:Pyruvate carboxyltransferase n=1 Tax=Ethanoligenens harbinense (strain DSM 18485 / JCM 12961 / CGMCC 1.5033 / YUAN-3) TaxID=663278 RepID=E6U4U6_ETHHY|nr:pyruvate carboxyltransferase [Ethanoligenens harbinense]ADU27831.1 pyruvate carboxyltransferase [Ethanoligenens harbinense YUAN-3]AVQ96854.1 pyruvate carboxyltransferase [Ethanoligenens harbinense YUAN-3]AYF39516.1 pyruvate carboxyltransferase [Ethanoligenens harbinense]AYF42341.1 pyruvate carboxyltransferase [Ethanoligenens harbinense]QCN93095.1 pyruvate carboxyltransferase [Ethanoligenens harbinense]
MIAVDFSDSTVECAVQRQLPSSEIEKMCETLGRYAVSCFDIRLDAYRRYLSTGNTPGTGRMRCMVGTAVEDAVQAADFRQVTVCVHQADPNGLKGLAAVVRAVKPGDVYLCLEDAWRMQPGEWEPIFTFTERYGIKGIVYCSEGAEDLFGLFERLRALVQNAPCPVEFKASNAFRMATAQTLAALRAGVGRVGVSAAGAGCRAPLEEVLMAAGHLWNVNIPSCRTLAEDFRAVLSMLDIRVPARKALIGPNIFAHESGIHVDGIVKNPSLYEVIRPEDVGLTRRLVIGKHSGNASVRIKLLQHGIRLSRQDAAALLDKVRILAHRQKRPLTDNQLLGLYEKYTVKGSLEHVGCKNF